MESITRDKTSTTDIHCRIGLIGIKAPLTRRAVALGGRFAPAGPLRLRLRGQGKPPTPAPQTRRKPWEKYGGSTIAVLMCLRDASGGRSRGQQAGKGKERVLRWVGGC